MELFEHEHPLKLIDMIPHYPNYEAVYSDGEQDENEEVMIIKQGFECLCGGCRQEINYFHRYYYRCDICNCSLHKSCGTEPQETLEHSSHPQHTLINLFQYRYYRWCSICEKRINREDHRYLCLSCEFHVHLGCAIKEVVKNEIIYHPSHRHPLMPTSKVMLAFCDACRKKHEGIFYLCITCRHFLIHKDCAFLSNKLFISQHTHPLTLAYSFPFDEQSYTNDPKCRLCDDSLDDHENLWIYKCENCRYYTHLDCATSRKEPFMSILKKPGMGELLKNFKDADYPNLLNLPFPDETYSILKVISPKEHKAHTLNIQTHKHPLIQVDTQLTMPGSSIISSSSCHDPMKNVQLLCNGCVRPITSMPFYKCVYEGNEYPCNFVLHEWCTRLPRDLRVSHHKHPLVLVPCDPSTKQDMFYCRACNLRSNGFFYSCMTCTYWIGVCCAFIPEHITHEAHPNHLLSKVKKEGYYCDMCRSPITTFSWSCKVCEFNLHVGCALLLPKTIKHKFDKHPMKLSYFPIENHKSDYVCEVCEEKLDPGRCFYHCHECDWSIHTACAPLILQCERNTYSRYGVGVYEYMNMKFGAIYQIKEHPHPLMLLQGIESDGECSSSTCTWKDLKNDLILKCIKCKFALHYSCSLLLGTISLLPF